MVTISIPYDRHPGVRLSRPVTNVYHSLQRARVTFLSVFCSDSPQCCSFSLSLRPCCWLQTANKVAERWEVVIFRRDPLIMLISLLIFKMWSPGLSISLCCSLFGIMSICLARITIFKTVSGDLCPHLLWSCCNCSFGAMSLDCSPSQSLPVAAIPHDLSPFFLPLHVFFPCTTH